MSGYVVYGRGRGHCLVMGRRSLGPLGLALMLAWMAASWMLSLQGTGHTSTGFLAAGLASGPQTQLLSEGTVGVSPASLIDAKNRISLRYLGGNVSTVVDSREQGMEAFGLINAFRAEAGRPALAWDENLYRLALYRSADMYEDGYFDHVDSEGRCAKTLCQDYNVSYHALSENIYGVDSNGAQEFSAYPEDAVEYWMASRGHRYNLLYEHHTAGAIACFRSRCTFLGASDWGGDTVDLGGGVSRRIEPLGSGDECPLAADGEAFWAIAPPQPGEI
jgi:uncharacterized protein YkwD